MIVIKAPLLEVRLEAETHWKACVSRFASMATAASGLISAGVTTKSETNTPGPRKRAIGCEAGVRVVLTQLASNSALNQKSDACQMP